MKILTVVLLVTSIMQSTSAQEDQTKHKGKLEIGIGFNFFGPTQQMADLMVKYGFNATSASSFFGPAVNYPVYQPLGFTYLISYSRYLGPRSQLGILFSHSGLREISGNSNLSEALDIKFSNVSVVPLYTFELSKYAEFQAGPALMINSWNNSSKLSPGLLSALYLKIWDGAVTYGKLGTSYLLTYGNKMGPFTGTYGTTIPESKINFGHLNILFSLGLNL
jgi:hypothetical protein